MKKAERYVAIYSRKSRYTGKGNSIGNQVEMCKNYIRDRLGADAAEHALVFEDEGYSGGNLDRPAFKELMEAAREGQISAVVAYKLDRISRNITDFSGLIDELARMNVSFISISEQFDTSTPAGRAMMYMVSVFSNLERDTIAERIRDNMHELAKTGRWLGGITPTGYRSEGEKQESVNIDGKPKKTYKLVLVPEEAELVHRIYQIYLEKESLTLTDVELLNQGIKTKNGREFTRFSIKGILQNPVYMVADQDAYDYLTELGVELFADRAKFDGEHGIMAYNRTNQEKGRTTEYLPPEKWIVTVGKHPGIIPGKMWIQVQALLERNRSKAFRKPRSNEALLTGLLYCTCGSRMYPKLSRRKTPDGKPVYTYVCKRKDRSRRQQCNGKNASGNRLDAAVVDQIKRLAADDSTFFTQLEQSRQFYAGNRVGYEQQLEAKRKERASLKRKIDNLVDTLTELGDSAAREPVMERLKELNQKAEELPSQIAELEALTSRNQLDDAEFDLMRHLLSVFHESIDQMSIDQKRAAIRTLVR